MSENPQRQRLRRIEGLQVEAGRLFTEATADTIKNVLRLAERDLGEAVELLHGDNIDSRMSTIRIVDSLIDLASSRLIGVDRALKAYGPDATVIG
jgi:hypothetical protein